MQERKSRKKSPAAKSKKTASKSKATRQIKTSVRRTAIAHKVKKAEAAKARPASRPRKEAKLPQHVAQGKLTVHDLNGKVVETLAMDTLFQARPIHTDVIYQSILMYRAGGHKGSASTLDRGHVRGGGKKPWRQKGTGRARHGSRRSPIWRGGGTTFGPSPRDYSYTLPSQIRRRAVVETLKDRIHEAKLFLVNRLELAHAKTRELSKILDTFKLRKPLVVVEARQEALVLASRNIPGVALKTADEVNALDVASHPECLATKGAYERLVKRLKK